MVCARRRRVEHGQYAVDQSHPAKSRRSAAVQQRQTHLCPLHHGRTEQWKVDSVEHHVWHPDEDECRPVHERRQHIADSGQWTWRVRLYSAAGHGRNSCTRILGFAWKWETRQPNGKVQHSLGRCHNHSQPRRERRCHKGDFAHCFACAYQGSKLAEEKGGRLSNMVFFVYNRIDTQQKDKLGNILQILSTSLHEAFHKVSLEFVDQ